jgi:hypothetical protein
MALLKTGDQTTAEWMAKRVGDRLRTYAKQSFTFGTTNGQSWTQLESTTQGETDGTNQSRSESKNTGKSTTTGTSTSDPSGSGGNRSKSKSQTVNQSSTTADSTGSSHQVSNSSTSGTNEGSSISSSESRTDSHEMRLEATVYASEFMSLPDPATTRTIAGYFIVPSMPIWRADVSISSYLSRLESPLESVPSFLPWQDDESVSKPTSWNHNDCKRLFPNEMSLCDNRDEGDDDNHAESDLPADFDF